MYKYTITLPHCHTALKQTRSHEDNDACTVVSCNALGLLVWDEFTNNSNSSSNNNNG